MFCKTSTQHGRAEKRSVFRRMISDVQPVADISSSRPINLSATDWAGARGAAVMVNGYKIMRRKALRFSALQPATIYFLICYTVEPA